MTDRIDEADKAFRQLLGSGEHVWTIVPSDPGAKIGRTDVVKLIAAAYDLALAVLGESVLCHWPDNMCERHRRLKAELEAKRDG